ncbi:chromatin modification- protein VID21 [Dimargaris xerosporica]|nr:chromatin modification- protein VID21 [Dimargaris xerosporica]
MTTPDRTLQPDIDVEQITDASQLQTLALDLCGKEKRLIEPQHEQLLLELYFWKHYMPQASSDQAAVTSDTLSQADFDAMAQTTSYQKFRRKYSLNTASELQQVPELHSGVVKEMPVARYREKTNTPTKTKLLPTSTDRYGSQFRMAANRSLELYGWQYKVQCQPLFKALQTARNSLSSNDWKVARDELKAFRTLQRIEVLKTQNQWAFRQLTKHAPPSRTKTHRDHVLDEMQWLQADFKEERKWKMAVCYQIGQWVMAWHRNKPESTASPSSMHTAHETLPVATANQVEVPSPTLAVEATNGESERVAGEADWLGQLSLNSGLPLDDTLNHQLLTHIYEYPLMVPPVFDEAAAYANAMDQSAITPISRLMSTLVSFESDAGATSDQSDVQLVPQKRTLEQMDPAMSPPLLAFSDVEQQLAGDTDIVNFPTRPDEYQDLLANPTDYTLPTDDYATFATPVYDGGYAGDHVMHRPRKLARQLPGTQQYTSPSATNSPFSGTGERMDTLGLTSHGAAPTEVPSQSLAPWTVEEDTWLLELVERYGDNWDLVADAISVRNHVPNSAPRNARDCFARWCTVAQQYMGAGDPLVLAKRCASEGLPPTTPVGTAGVGLPPTPGLRSSVADDATKGSGTSLDERRGQRLQTLSDAMRKAAKKRQDIQARNQQALALQTKKPNAATDAVPTPTESEGSAAARESVEPSNPNGTSVPTATYRSPLELSAAKQELDQYNQLALRRQRSINATQWNMHNLTRNMMGRPGFPLNRPVSGLPVRPPAGVPGAPPAAVPTSGPEPMAPTNLAPQGPAPMVPGGGLPSLGTLPFNAAGINPAIARGMVARLGGLTPQMANRLTPEQLQMVLATRQAQLARQAAAAAAGQGGPNPPLGSPTPGPGSPTPASVSSTKPRAPTQPVPASASNPPGNASAAPSTGHAVALSAPNASVPNSTRNSEATGTTDGSKPPVAAGSAITSPSAMPKSDASAPPVPPSLMSPQGTNLSFLAAQFANLTPGQKMQLLRHQQQQQAQQYQQLLNQQQLQQVQQQSQAQLRHHLQRMQMIQQQQQRAQQAKVAAQGGAMDQGAPREMHSPSGPAKALGLASGQPMASGGPMAAKLNMNGMTPADFLAALEKQKQMQQGFNAEKLRHQLLQQQLASAAQASHTAALLGMSPPTGPNGLMGVRPQGATHSPNLGAQHPNMRSPRPLSNSMPHMGGSPGQPTAGTPPRMRPSPNALNTPTSMMGSPPMSNAVTGLSPSVPIAGLHSMAPSFSLQPTGMPVSAMAHTPPARPSPLPNPAASPNHNPFAASMTGAMGASPVRSSPNFSVLQASLMANPAAANSIMAQAFSAAQRPVFPGNGAGNGLAMNPALMAAMAAKARMGQNPNMVHPSPNTNSALNAGGMSPGTAVAGPHGHSPALVAASNSPATSAAMGNVDLSALGGANAVSLAAAANLGGFSIPMTGNGSPSMQNATMAASSPADQAAATLQAQLQSLGAGLTSHPSPAANMAANASPVLKQSSNQGSPALTQAAPNPSTSAAATPTSTGAANAGSDSSSAAP